MKMTFIYALCEPGTRIIRYIGKASNVERRLREHYRHTRKAKNHTGHWLNSVLMSGKFPNLIILKEISCDGWREEERRYIASAKMLGFNLTNSTDGGDGLSNPSSETRIKMRAIAAARSPETRSKMGRSMIGEKNPMFGIKVFYTAEMRAKRGLNQLGNKNSFFGKTHSDKTKAKISDAQKLRLAIKKG